MLQPLGSGNRFKRGYNLGCIITVLPFPLLKWRADVGNAFWILENDANRGQITKIRVGIVHYDRGQITRNRVGIVRYGRGQTTRNRVGIVRYGRGQTTRSRVGIVHHGRGQTTTNRRGQTTRSRVGIVHCGQTCCGSSFPCRHITMSVWSTRATNSGSAVFSHTSQQ